MFLDTIDSQMRVKADLPGSRELIARGDQSITQYSGKQSNVNVVQKQEQSSSSEDITYEESSETSKQESLS